MAGIEEAFEKFVTRVSSRERSPAEESLSKYKSYSEQELLGNLSAKYPNYELKEENMLYNMPMYEPMDVLPPRSMPVMPQIMNRDREYMDLAEGGVAGLAITSVRPTQKEIDDFVNRPIAVGQAIPVNEFLPGEDYQTYVRRKRRETGPALFAGEPVTMPVLPSTSTPQVDVSANPVARALEMAGFTKEEIMRILGQQGLAEGGSVETGLTTTVPPAKGPDSQGVESLFRRRYS
jgi:hypothetical protein